MKLFILLNLILLSVNTYGQKANLETVRNFWDTNIMEIVRLDREKIIEHTNFPLEGSWGYVLELSDDQEDWKDEDYKSNLDKIFNEETRALLKGMTYNYLVHHMDSNNELNFILQLNFKTKIDDETLESTTILYFKRYDEIWKLYKIEYAG